MATIWAETALLPDGWARNVRIDLRDGRIGAVTPGAAPEGQRVACLIPAGHNLHSHAFQRAMAGMTERRGHPQDTFWTWRQLMYRFLDQLTPEDVEAIAAFVQVEMLEAGYASVCEFHYLHHAPGGVPYTDLAELAKRVIAASQETGIGLTLLPVAYEQGGCDGRPLQGGQMRFGNDFNRFQRLVEDSSAAIKALPDGVIGVAPHSLRAVSQHTLAACAGLPGPLHMHLAEQVGEVAEVEAAWRARPVEWVLANTEVGPRNCFIHLTQMLPHETAALARTGAVAGLCPITEASLGDGIFDGLRWLAAGGAFGVGSDSNIRIAQAEELRGLEYSQRLRDRGRAMLATDDLSTGRVLLEGAARGGAQAAGRQSGKIEAGCWADVVALDMSAVDLEGRQGDAILDAWIFAGDDRMVAEVWSAGRHVVKAGRHVARDTVEARYRAVMRRLVGSL
jgi:formimidoylglutamate deiminase